MLRVTDDVGAFMGGIHESWDVPMIHGNSLESAHEWEPPMNNGRPMISERIVCMEQKDVSQVNFWERSLAKHKKTEHREVKNQPQTTKTPRN